MCYRTAHSHSHHGKHHSGQHAGSHWKHQFASQWGYPPVNVEERDDHYLVSVYAAGYVKSDFQVSLVDNNLVIAVHKPENESNTHFGRRPYQFKPGNFKKEFELNDKIDKEGISAKYEEGILKVTLPKLAGYETLRQDIGVA
ncbi:MAG: Hsp20/alpha crystallin family protein [Saprospirales bacterium]|nr:Hsp20/alpha crystallin family protein [Saprospirales bacterium]